MQLLKSIIYEDIAQISQVALNLFSISSRLIAHSSKTVTDFAVNPRFFCTPPLFYHKSSLTHFFTRYIVTFTIQLIIKRRHHKCHGAFISSAGITHHLLIKFYRTVTIWCTTYFLKQRGQLFM